MKFKSARPLLFLLFIALISSKIYGQNKLPNVVIIYADDLGYGDLSSYGGDIPTPNIDKIGKGGIRFTDFYVTAPTCTPSRFSLLTGSYPQRSVHQLYHALMPGSTNYLDNKEKILAGYLKDKGYATAIFGKWHLGEKDSTGLPTDHGFDTFSGFKGGCIDYFTHVYGEMGPDWYINGKLKSENGYSTELIANHALRYIENIKSNSAPFFLYLPFNAPHYGKTDPNKIPDHTESLKETKQDEDRMINSLQAPPKYMQRFASVQDPYRKTYSAMVSSLDDQVGRILEKLQTAGMMENTIIWFISDNGGYSESYFGHADNGGLRGEKTTLWEGGIRVPAMVLWKNKIKPNQVIETPICNTDIVPTLAAIIGFKNKLSPSVIDGQDISDVLFHGKSMERSIYWNYKKQSALRMGDWKLRDNKALFNLKDDKFETTDLAKSNPDMLKKLQTEFAKIDQRVNPKLASE